MSATTEAAGRQAAVQRARTRAASGDEEQRRRLTRQAIRRAGRGDRDALRDLYVRYEAPVHRQVLAIVRDEQEAQDVTQRVFVKLMSDLPQYEEQRGDFSAWLLRVARNLAIDEVRRRRTVPASDVGQRPESRSDHATLERTQALREALAALSNEQREVVVLRHLAGMGPRQIAARLSKTEAAVHALHHRGRTAMRASLLRADVYPVTRTRRPNVGRSNLGVELDG
jgi:RNA polymerase sigma-70 factor, ECF subfamily